MNPHTANHFDPTFEWNRRLQAVYAAASTRIFIEAAFNLLRATVRCDFLLFHDFVDEKNFPVVRDSQGKEYPFDSVQNAHIVEAATAYAQVRPGTRLIPAPGGLLADAGCTDHLGPCTCVLFWGKRHSGFPETAFSVFRLAGQRDFSSDDFAALDNVHPHLETALDCLKTRLDSRSTQEGLVAVIRDLPLGSILLNWELNVVYANRSGKKHWITWRQGESAKNLKFGRRDCSVPTEIEQACREIQRDWTASLRDKSPTKFCKVRRVEHGAQPCLHATITILSHRTPMARPSFLVRIERRPEAKAKTPKTTFSASVLDILTLSEREVALKTSEGLSNQEIADELGKTVCAVKFLQHMIYKKLQISNRSRLVALLRPEVTR